MKLQIGGIKIDLALFMLGAVPIFFSGWLGEGGTEIRMQQFVLLEILLLLFLAVTHSNRFIGVFLVLCLAHFGFYKDYQLFAPAIEWIFCHALLYDIVAKNYRGKSYPVIILAVLALNLVMAGVQWFKQDVFLDISGQTPGFMTLPLYIGIYSAITAPILCNFHPAVLILSFIGLAISRSSFSALAMAAGLFFYLWHRSKKVAVGFLAISLVAVTAYTWLYDAPEGQFGRRFHVWKLVISRAFVNPVFGVGIGSYWGKYQFLELRSQRAGEEEYFQFRLHPENEQSVYDKIVGFATDRLPPVRLEELKSKTSIREMKDVYGRNGMDIYFWDNPHNEYLLIFFEFGFIGLALLLAYMVDIWERFYVRRSIVFIMRPGRMPHSELATVSLMASAIAIAIIAFAHFPFGIAKISSLCVFVLALLDSKLKGGE